MHSTDNLEDDYLGSGKVLKRSIAKYGKENFKREILEEVSDRETLKEREKEIVNKEEVDNVFCMNLKLGGQGGGCSKEHYKLMKRNSLIQLKENWKDKEYRRRKTEEMSKRMKEVFESGERNVKDFRCNWSGRKHKEESKLKQSQAKKGTGLKETNSQFGSCWITNGIENKKIKKEQPIPLGFYKGRV